MERENTQSKRGYSERSRRSSNYEPRNTADSRGYGTRSFNGDNEHRQYIDSRYRSSELMDRSGPYTGKGPKGYKRSEEQIVEEACLRLERAGDVDASEVEVGCEEGVITLRGRIENRASKRRAEECVEYIYGVHDIMNELQVSKGLFTNLFDAGDGNVTRDELLGKL